MAMVLSVCVKYNFEDMIDNEKKYSKEFALAKEYSQKKRFSQVELYTIIDNTPVFYCYMDYEEGHKTGLPHLVYFEDGKPYRLNVEETISVMHSVLHPSDNL